MSKDTAVATAIDELGALARTGHRPSHRRYVTEATRITVRAVTGMTVNMSERWDADDIRVAYDALSEVHIEEEIMKYVVLVDVTDHGEDDPEPQMLTEYVTAKDEIEAASKARAQAIDVLTAGLEGEPVGPFTAYTTVMTAEAYAKATGR